MTNALPKFDAPPVVETVLSVQFARLEKFSDAHAGWFWKGYLGEEWASVQTANPLEDQFERFGDQMKWGPAVGGIRIMPGGTANRLQIVRADNERMIQIQDSRFIYNWKKERADYPNYDKVLLEFKNNFEIFKKFVEDANLGPLALNQWEVTYVNHIPKESLWSSFEEWSNILPGFFVPRTDSDKLAPELFRGEWRFTITGNRGRLYINIDRGRVGSEKGPEVMRAQLTSRGPVNSEIGMDLQSGFDLGHESIVRTFTAMTSPVAHKYWERRI